MENRSEIGRKNLKTVETICASIFKFPLHKILFILLSFFAACKNDKEETHVHSHEHATEEMNSIKYTCPMHPQIVQDAPGSCPICGMDLMPVNKSTTESTDLMLSDTQMRLANITVQKVTPGQVGQIIAINGNLAENEALTEVVSSRADGRIEKLYIKETGRTIQKGAPLYQLYSENLLTLQREYLLAKEQYETLGTTQTRYKSFLDAARRKLVLYGMTEKQIEKLTTAKDLNSRITFLSPATGVVTEITATEGQYIAEGTTLYRIENIDKLWVEAELYPAETSLVQVGDKVDIKVSGFEDDPIEGTITFLSPEYKAGTQITIMRAIIDNPNLLYTPGVQAQVLFMHSSKKALAIPVDAVIRDGKGAHVYVQKGRNTFMPQPVKTGIEGSDSVEIVEGLAEGDTVVTTGAYLLYSEIILKKGTDPMAAHSH